MSKCDERFARQYRYEPPPGFPLASPSSDIVHHLSGPNKCAHTQTFHRGSRPAVDAHVSTVTFISHTSLNLTYSHMCMDSLVRVSRRVVWLLAPQHQKISIGLSCAKGLGIIMRIKVLSTAYIRERSRLPHDGHIARHNVCISKTTSCFLLTQ